MTPILKQRRFGSRERGELKDWIFELQRQKTHLEKQLDVCIQQVGGVPPNRRQKDLALILAVMTQEQRIQHRASAGNLITVALNHFLDQLPETQKPQGFPPWIQEKIRAQFGDQAQSIEDRFLEKATPAFAMDTNVISRDQLLKEINKEEAIAHGFKEVPDGFWCTTHFPLQQLPPQLKDQVWPMDLGSQLIAHLLNVQPEDEVLDMCAGGGGKTKALLRYSSKVTATDISQQRMTATQKRTKHNRSVTYHCLDMTEEQLTAESFDRILVDAPCSGVGTVRRHPDILQRLQPDQLKDYVTIQKRLLAQAHRLCRPKGHIVYATCSFLAEENDDVIAWAQENLALEPVPLHRMQPQGVLAGHELTRHAMYFLPHEFLSDGFFVAAFQKGIKKPPCWVVSFLFHGGLIIQRRAP